MANRYSHVSLPSWTENASKERLLEHIQYLTNDRDRAKGQLRRARYRYRKAEKELMKLRGENNGSQN